MWDWDEFRRKAPLYTATALVFALNTAVCILIVGSAIVAVDYVVTKLGLN